MFLPECNVFLSLTSSQDQQQILPNSQKLQYDHPMVYVWLVSHYQLLSNKLHLNKNNLFFI